MTRREPRSGRTRRNRPPRTRRWVALAHLTRWGITCLRWLGSGFAGSSFPCAMIDPHWSTNHMTADLRPGREPASRPAERRSTSPPSEVELTIWLSLGIDVVRPARGRYEPFWRTPSNLTEGKEMS